MAKEQYTGIVLGDSYIEWTVVNKTKGRLTSVDTGHIDLDPPTGDSDGARPQLSAAQMKSLGRSARGVVSLALPSDKVLLRVLDLPEVEDDELAGMVELQVDKFSPFPIDSLVVSHDILSRGDGTCKVLAAAAREQSVEDIVAASIDQSAIKISRIDLCVLGWMRLLRDEGKTRTEGRQIILILDGFTPSIVVFENGVPIVFRALTDTTELDEDERINEIISEVGYTLMTLELEHGGAVAKVIDVFSADTVVGELKDGLRGECSCEVNTWLLSSLPPLSEGIARRMADAAGRRIDMTPVSWLLAAQAKKSKRKMIGVSVFLLSIWVLLVGGFFGYFKVEESRMASLQAERAKWAGPADEVGGMIKRIRLIEQYMDRSDSALECLREVTAMLPANSIILISFSYGKGEDLKISGEADSRTLVLEFNDSLNKSKIFTEVVPGEINIVGGKHRFSFTLKLPGGKE